MAPQTIRFGSVRYSTPPSHVGSKVWCRVVGEELTIVAGTGCGLVEIPAPVVHAG